MISSSKTIMALAAETLLAAPIVVARFLSRRIPSWRCERK